MDTIKHILKPYYKKISESENEMIELVRQMYTILKENLTKIIDFSWLGPKSKLAILGGIMINCDGKGNDRF